MHVLCITTNPFLHGHFVIPRRRVQQTLILNQLALGELGTQPICPPGLRFPKLQGRVSG